jgi:hypothetical protein
VTNCIQTAFDFPALSGRKVQAGLTDIDITSDGGVLQLRQIDITPDSRRRYIKRSQQSLLR